MPLLTDLMIRQTKAPTKGRIELWDSKASGLIFRATEAGVRTWSLLYRWRGKRRRLTLGAYRPEGSASDGLTLAQARARARAALRDVADGRDPQGEKLRARAESLRAGATFAELAESWLQSPAAAAWKPKTTAEFTRLVRVELVPALGDLRPDAVSKADIRAVYDRVAARSEAVAHHLLAVLRLLYRWAADEDHVDTVPVFPRRGMAGAPRKRVLEESELRAVWMALQNGIGTTPKPGRVDLMAEAFKVLLLTGQRRGEVLSMRWADVTEEADGAWWTIPAERHKGGRVHRVPLAADSVDALKRLHTVTGSEEWIFPAPKAGAKVAWVANPQKAAERLWKVSGVKEATLHDMRRSCATYLVRLGVPRLVVGKVLGHADSDVTGRYDQHAYDREKRAALNKWANELRRIVTAKEEDASPAKVLPWSR